MALDRIEVIYKAVTPMFCGGARPATVELRLSSFKGVLRWWWRALAWSRYGHDLTKIKGAEDRLFGSANRGRGKVVIRCISMSRPMVVSPPAVLHQSAGDAKVVGEGARYLGYGAVWAFARQAQENRPEVKAGQLIRACLQSPFELRIELRCRDLNKTERELLLDALRAMGLLGGLGAKSRKGYGSIVLQALVINGSPAWAPPRSLPDLAAAVKSLYSGSLKPTELPPYTALSACTRHVLLTTDGQVEALALLDRVGREIVRYRSKGRKAPTDGQHKVLGGVVSELNFDADHQLMLDIKAHKKLEPTGHPRRVVFGLPHNYQEGNVEPAADLNRRASPLLIHVHEVGDAPVVVLSYLPARFLPEGARVSVGKKTDKGRVINPGIDAPLKDGDFWKPIDDLLDRFLLRNPGNELHKRRAEFFSQALEVRP
jgi:CRISPR-associated protein Cmr1